MRFPSTWTGAIVVAVVIITISKPITALLDDILSIGRAFSSCRYSSCARYPICRRGYDIVSTTRRGCPFSKHKNYCCRREPTTPTSSQCLFTKCGRKITCPQSYHELDHTRNGCSGSNNKAYCCKATDLPYCFDLSCPAASEPAKFCPLGYNEMARVKGRTGGCESAFAERVTCCFTVPDNGNSGNQSVSSNTGNQIVSPNIETSESEDFSQKISFNQSATSPSTSAAFNPKNETFKMEDGRIKVVRKTQIKSSHYENALFGNASSTFERFFQILLIFPVLIVRLISSA